MEFRLAATGVPLVVVMISIFLAMIMDSFGALQHIRNYG
jgi:hypothetical protein